MMIQEASDGDVRKAINAFLAARSRASFQYTKQFKKHVLADFAFEPQQIETMIVQLRALGLIDQSVRQRSGRDSRTFWRLTKHGDNLMTNLRALRKPRSEGKAPVQATKPATKA